MQNVGSVCWSTAEIIDLEVVNHLDVVNQRANWRRDSGKIRNLKLVETGVPSSIKLKCENWNWNDMNNNTL